MQTPFRGSTCCLFHLFGPGDAPGFYVHHGLNSAESRRISDPAPPSWDPAPLFGDPTPKLGNHSFIPSFLHSFIHSFIQALKQVSNTVYSKIMTTETVNKFRVISGRKSPLTRYHRAIQILQCYVANNPHTHTTQITNIKQNVMYQVYTL